MNALETKITKVMQDTMAKGDLAGANVLILKNGVEQVYCEAGYRDLENKKPMTRDTIFRLYSMTKPITAAAVMKLVSDGKVDLASNIADYLPEFSNPHVNVNGIRKKVEGPFTVQQFMNMTSGLCYPDLSTEAGKQSAKVWDEVNARLYTDHPMTTREFSEKMGQVDLNFEPGSRFQYGSSADIMGALVERVSGVSFREYLMKHFFEPMEMIDTDFYVPEEKRERMMKTYDVSEKGLYEFVTDNLGVRYDRDVLPAFESGGAGLCATIDDYAKFGAMLIAGGVYKGQRILPERAVKFMSHGGLSNEIKHNLVEGFQWMHGYTYGNLVRVCEDESKTALFSEKGEYGWDGWLGTFFSNEPKSGITMVFGTQKKDVNRSDILYRKIKNMVMSELA